MGHIISCINQKGGVAKTTTTHTLARELAKTHKVLMVDFDGQATLTKLLNLSNYFDKDALDNYMQENSLLKIFKRKTVEPLDITDIVKTNENCSSALIKELHVLPSPGKDLSFVADAVPTGKNTILKRYLNTIKDDYDYILIDSLPSLSTLFENILWASNSLIIPIQTKFNAMTGANDFVKIIDDVMFDYNFHYKSIFILPTMYNMQRKDDKETLVEIKTSYLKFIKACSYIGESNVKVLDTIPERAIFSKSQSYGIFLQDYIECYDKGKSDLLLLLEKIAKEITSNCE